MTEWLVRRFVKDHQNTGNVQVRTRYGQFAGIVGIICNLLLCLGKGIIGLVAGSVSIVADAVNNLSDAASNIISLLGFKLASKPADPEHPYGHGRYEYLSGLAVAILIVFIGWELLRSSYDKIVNPSPTEFNAAVVCVLVLSILVKLWMMVFNRTLGRRINSTTLEATAVDSRNDVISTGVVLLCAIASHFTGVDLDGWVGLAVGAFIVWSGVQLVRDTVDPLLGRVPDPELVTHIHDKIMSYPGVLGTHDLMVHDYGPGRRFASVHVEMAAENDVMQSHDIIDNIERDFQENDHISLIIHYDPILTGDDAVGTAREWVKELVRSISPELSIHDFRMVQGPSHTNLIFDTVVPHNFPLSDAALRKRIQSLVETHDAGETKYYAVVTIDHSYAAIPGACKTDGKE